MSDILPFVVIGLVTGSIYGLAGTGLVLTYKTSGIFNFAHPAAAAIGAYAFYFLTYDEDYFDLKLPWGISALIVIFVVGPLMGIVLEWAVRGLATVAIPLQVVATIGLALGTIGGLGLLYTKRTRILFPSFLPTDLHRIGGVNVTELQIIVFVFAAVSTAVLYLFFKKTRLGMAMRAVVDNPELMDLTGMSAVRVSRSAWIIGTTFAVASGVLMSAIRGNLNASALFFFMISSFGAAAVGAFASLPLTFVGGLGLGVLGALATKYSQDISFLGGMQPALPFIALLLVLIFIDKSKLVDNRVAKPKPMAQSYQAPWRVKAVAAAVFLVAAATIPWWREGDLRLYAGGLCFMILVLSLGLLVKESGQVSLCQTGFAAVGATTFAHASNDWNLPWVLALVIASFVAAAAGLVVAIPAIRVSGVFLAIATLGFGLALQNLFYPTELMFTTATDGLGRIPRPGFAQSDRAFYWVILLIVVLVSLLLVSIHFGRLGRILRGLGDSALALNTMGTAVNVTRVIVFFISAFLAGLAGALYASFFQGAGITTPLFQPILSLNLFALIILIAAAAPWYGMMGGLALQVFPDYFTGWFNIANIQPWLSLLFGVSAVSVAIQADRRPGLPAAWIRFFERFRGEPPPLDDALALAPERPRPSGEGLEVRELVVRFGGVVAVNHLSLHAPYGRITGLIGPNGAGKTTTFNACSGLLNPSEGAVYFDGADISRVAVAARARSGIGRTFQRAELWDSLSVRENVELGVEAPWAGAGVLAQLTPKRGEVVEMRARAAEALELTGITHLASRRVGDLPAGQRRLVELARVLAGPFDLLLLDEPSSGLDKVETDEFGAVLKKVVAERGTGILLVEHDMRLVMDLCQHIYVMDFGSPIFEGPPAAVSTSDIVRAAYLGTEEVETAGA